MIEIRHLIKTYPTPGGGTVTALRLEQAEVGPGEHTAVVGPSGSGKSTLLAILAGILPATSGRISWDGEAWPPGRTGGEERNRARRVGFVFQDLNLLPALNLYDNLAAAAGFLGAAADAADLDRVLDRVGLLNKRERKPGQLSRGEQQRAAVARATLYPHPLILADEPTASLDADNARQVMDLLIAMASENGSALVVATHDPRVLDRFGRRWELAGQDGAANDGKAGS